MAVGVNDITKSVLNSQYFIYDPDYSFLCLGVVGAIHEIEFMKMVKKKYNPDFVNYQLGELVLGCPKVNYKLNYKPGLLICPRTKKIVTLEAAKEKMIAYSKMPIQFKKDKLTHCELVDNPPDFMTDNEVLAISLKEFIPQMNFLYQETRMLPIDCLQQGGKDHVIPILV